MSLNKQILRLHLACPDCGSSDALTEYKDEHTHCYSCGKTTFHQEREQIIEEPKTEYRALTDRNISLSTAQRYKVTVEVKDGIITRHHYPYSCDDQPIAIKTRNCQTKDFRSKGAWDKAQLFGQELFPPGSAKAITITEGELDAMAAFEMSGSRFPCVSIKNGAKSAVKDCTQEFEYLNSFDKIVICFDKDEAKISPDGSAHFPGQEAALAVAALFPIGKVHILTLQDGKDPNEYLLKNKSTRYVDEWWKAPPYTPTGLKLGKDMWEEISAPKNHETTPYPFEGLNLMTYGIRLSEFVLVTAETGVGKTKFISEIEHHILNKTTKGVGFLHLEEPNSDTALGLMSITANKPLHLPDVRETVKNDELRKYYDSVVNTDRVVIWDHFGSNSIHEVLAKIRHMHNLGCKYIVLDHLSIIVSDQSGDERKQLDEICTKLKTLCMELNIAVIAVIHLNRQGNIRSSAGPEQLSNITIRLSRNKKDMDEWRRNVTFVEIDKNRFCGRTGPACYLFYQPETGRLRQLDKDEVHKYESGQSVNAEEAW